MIFRRCVYMNHIHFFFFLKLFIFETLLFDGIMREIDYVFFFFLPLFLFYFFLFFHHLLKCLKNNNNTHPFSLSPTISTGTLLVTKRKNV